jgi:L-alanine-DL-glutamate epimerase-like enolase superfamily enzyme
VQPDWLPRPMHAIRVAREIERYNPFWYEEPTLAENIPTLAETNPRTATWR